MLLKLRSGHIPFENRGFAFKSQSTDLFPSILVEGHPKKVLEGHVIAHDLSPER